MCVTTPLVLNPRFSWLADCRLPLPDTVDCTTPFATVAVLVLCAVLRDACPTVVYATTIATIHSTPRVITNQGRSLRLDTGSFTQRSQGKEGNVSRTDARHGDTKRPRTNQESRKETVR